ncbi:MAG: hypothetical protein D6689_20645 [Deltaproteobacteria bacterium]|nr:MAG: hypothetical protein D6689_20645 [Deltaproteobacteria bacterium]
MATANSTAQPREAERARVTLLYIREPAAPRAALDARVATIAARHAPHVAVVPVAPGDVPAPYARWSAWAPCVLVLRDGAIVGEAIGASLPVRELDRVVRCAVEWRR